LRIWLDDLEVVRGGQERVAGVEAQAMSIVAQKEFQLRIDLGAGKASSRRFCSDLTTEYVRFNSAYRT
jgi:N-acetylglutamate synthase/N-acetylornithine aminotransferase